MEHESHESNNSGSFAELPQPQEANKQNHQESGAAEQPEVRGARAPSAGSPQSKPQSDSATPDPQAAAPPPQPDPSASMSSAALMADDADLIEKEWVVRAKSIVDQTKDDPHTQNREMNKVKADYLKKRYNKDLKLNEG